MMSKEQKPEPEWMKKGREKAEKAAKEKIEKSQKDIDEILKDKDKK